MASAQERRVALASLIGGSVEYYEFFIYGLSASLVFGREFFPTFSPAAGTLLSLSTFAIAFIARPVGGWLFGHYGDRIGRKTMLILTLAGMGGATTLVGLMPGYTTIGVWAPILLVVLRIVQGLSVAGESSGGFLLTFEHSERGGRPGLFTGTVSTGNIWGLLLSNGVFALVNLLPKGQFDAWGWRLPFLSSAVLVAIGLYVRSKLSESPGFQRIKDRGQVSRNPALDVLRQHPGNFIGIILVTIPQSVYFYIASVFALTYTTRTHVTASTISLVVTIISAALLFVMPLVGWIADRNGRPRTVFGIGLVIMAVTPFLWFPLFDSGNLALVFVGFALLLGGFAANYGTQGMLYPPLFAPHLRYTATAISVAVGGVLGGAIAPLIAIWLLDSFGTWVPIAVYMTLTAVIALVATAFLRVYVPPQAMPAPDTGRPDGSSTLITPEAS
ncbi:MAG TPA: MFS transporter [Trebonia sp.]|jgi:MFS family permease